MEGKNSVTLSFVATRERNIVAGLAGLALTVTLLASCGENTTAPSATAPPVSPPGSAGTTRTFTNPAPIAIPDGAPNVTEGTAAPYPSTMDVSGMPPGITNVKVGVSGLSHTAPEDVGLLLAGPQGHRVVLMSRAGCANPIENVGLTFDDAAGLGLSATLISSGSYRPTAYGSGDSFQGPAPPGPYGVRLDVFRGTDPNGEWRLYVLDRSGNNIGSIGGGWTIEITSGGPPSTVEGSGRALSADRGSALDSGCSSGH
jgi:hypothetical protein